MVNLVCGVGPRVGSSFVMRQCKVAGLPVLGTKYMHGQLPAAGNPGGYYCLTPEEVSRVTVGVAKVWPMQLPLMPVPANKVVVLERRDLDAQRRSIDIQSKRENFPVDADELIQKSATVLTRYIKEIDPEVLFVSTEDLNSQIKNIINFLGE